MNALELKKDVAETEKAVREKRSRESRALFAASTIPYRYLPEHDVLVVRDRNYPAIDFFCGTGTWRIGIKMHMGGAAELLRLLALKDAVRQ